MIIFIYKWLKKSPSVRNNHETQLLMLMMLLPPPPPLLRLIPRGPIPPREDGAARRRPARPPCPACVPCGRWAVNVMSLIMMALLGEYLCMRRELQDIPLFGSSARRKPSDSSF